jgi:hypothetical protein
MGWGGYRIFKVSIPDVCFLVFFPPAVPRCPVIYIFFSTGVWIRVSCLLGRHWTTPPALFVSIIFKISHLCPGQPEPCSSYLCILCSKDDSLCYQCLAIGYDRVSWTFWLGWPWTAIFLISASQVARLQIWASPPGPVPVPNTSYDS